MQTSVILVFLRGSKGVSMRVTLWCTNKLLTALVLLGAAMRTGAWRSSYRQTDDVCTLQMSSHRIALAQHLQYSFVGTHDTPM